MCLFRILSSDHFPPPPLLFSFFLPWMGFSFANNPPSPRKKKRKEMINVFFLCMCVWKMWNGEKEGRIWGGRMGCPWFLDSRSYGLIHDMPSMFCSVHCTRMISPSRSSFSLFLSTHAVLYLLCFFPFVHSFSSVVILTPTRPSLPRFNEKKKGEGGGALRLLLLL